MCNENRELVLTIHAKQPQTIIVKWENSSSTHKYSKKVDVGQLNVFARMLFIYKIFITTEIAWLCFEGVPKTHSKTIIIDNI